MAQTVLSVRIDKDLKTNFDALCNNFGLSTSAAFTLFMKAVIRERRIPFEIKEDTKEAIGVKGWEAFLRLSEQAKDGGLQDLPLDQINEMIKESRDECK